MPGVISSSTGTGCPFVSAIGFWIRILLSGGVETATTGGACSSIYALQMGEGAVCGLTAPGFVTVEPIGSLETKDASRNRIKWYVSLALFSAIKAAALIGVQDN